jgi:hypothetical protein
MIRYTQYIERYAISANGGHKARRLFAVALNAMVV